ncbi:hypothetical protein [Nostoc sp.]|uniref:hypothetical protein n=1 Tax=Nostoc sp. TaxID=1180 RepID=UPI002FFAD1B7
MATFQIDTPTNPGNQMTTTVRELLEVLKDYREEMVVVIKDVNDQKFPIIDFQSQANTLNIIIGEKQGEEEEEQPQINS